MQIPTVKIKAKNELGYMTINKDDFDEDNHKLYAESVEVEEPVREIVEESPATIKVGDKIKTSKRKPGRPPLNKKENPFD